jgi:site-specific DNA-methyltransferase (adenine-specific)
MEMMAEYEDNYFDLAIVDPPYGIGEKLVQGGTWAKDRKNGYSGWDVKPDGLYFKELFRVSKNQIIWGGNYFALSGNRCFLIWDKPSMRIPTMSDCEYAWTSFNHVAKIFRVNQEKGEARIHLSQKPVLLYKKTLGLFGKEGDKILDTHMGSGSIAIACHYMGFNLTACELDPDYYKAACERIKRETKQLSLF